MEGDNLKLHPISKVDPELNSQPVLINPKDIETHSVKVQPGVRTEVVLIIYYNKTVFGFKQLYINEI